jgi:hypothetical protein
VDQVDGSIKARNHGLALISPREDKVWNHDPFTKALVNGLGGEAVTDRENAVRVNGLAGYIAS